MTQASKRRRSMDVQSPGVDGAGALCREQSQVLIKPAFYTLQVKLVLYYNVGLYHVYTAQYCLILGIGYVIPALDE